VRRLKLYRLLGDRGSFTAIVGEVAQHRAVHARKLIGFAAHIATGIANNARINIIRSSCECGKDGANAPFHF
jgi:hypothetical protein